MLSNQIKLLFITFLFISPLAKSQNSISVINNNGSKTVYPLNQIKNIKFKDSKMIVNDISGDIDSLNIIKINKMIFSIKVITPLYESKNNNIDAYIYPNPFIQKINIELNLQENQDINLSLYSIQGVKIIEKKIQGTTGANHIYFNTNKINIGNYILYVNEKPYKIIKL